MHHELGYLDKIREQGFRVTPQRELILDTLCHTGGHVTAVAVYDQAKSQMPALNQATVYRVLDFFCDLHIAAKTDIAGRSVYELVGAHPHHHLVCRNCNAVINFEAHHFEILARNLIEEYGFHPDLKHLVMAGLCAKCYEDMDQQIRDRKSQSDDPNLNGG